MSRQVKLCKNGDGGKHYAGGYCQACYMRVRRGGATTPDSVDEEPEAESNVQVGEPLAPGDLDALLFGTNSRVPSAALAIQPHSEDSDGVKRMRAALAKKTYLARREVVKTMLFDGYEIWQVKNEFLSRRELFTRFVLPLKDPDRTLDEDINAIRNEGLNNPLARYAEGLRRSLRRANSFADSAELPAKERSTWAKAADDIQRNLAILEKAIHVVPGRGDLPLDTYGSYDDPDDEDDEDEYRLPDVETGLTAEEIEEYSDKDTE